jgi:translocation and assembly module TamB
VTRRRAFPGRPAEDAVDDDVICHLEARARVDDHGLLLRRLSLAASVDYDPDPGTRPSCALGDDDWRRLELRASGVEVGLYGLLPGPRPDDAPEDAPLKLVGVEGRVGARIPVALAHRFLSLAHTTGSLDLELEARYAPGDTLPALRGTFRADTPGIDGKVFSKRAEGNVDVAGKIVRVTDLRANWGNGDFVIPEVELHPFDKGITLDARGIVADGVELQGLLRDLGAHPQAYVGWGIDHVEIPRFGGTLDPLALEGPLVAKTTNFGVYDRPAHRPDKQRMVSVSGGDVAGIFAVAPTAVILKDMHLTTPRSHALATVKLGFDDQFGLDVAPGTQIDFAELSPLVSVPIGGVVTVEAHGTGTFGQPRISGDISVKGFSIGGFDAGDIRHAKAAFRPLALDLTEAELVAGGSLVTSPNAHIAFDEGPDVLVEADLDTTKGSGLFLRDFFDVFHFADDPRFASFAGVARGQARVRYALGGTDDRCGGGALDVRTTMHVTEPQLFGETFESGDADVRFRWDDQAASGEGMNIDVYSASVKDGPGSIVAKAQVRYGGVMHGSVVASALPLSRLESMGALGKILDGEASAVGTVSGTLARPEGQIDVTLSPLRAGPETLPSSHFAVAIEPIGPKPVVVGTTRCKNPIGEPWNRAEWEKDVADGRFRLNGALFGGQVRLEDLTMTEQRARVVAGKVFLSGLDLGKLANLVPGIAFQASPPSGKLSAEIDIARLAPGDLGRTDAKITLFDFHVDQAGRTIALDDATDVITIANDTLTVPELKMVLKDKSGLSVDFAANGKVGEVFEAPTVDASMKIAPFDLSKLRGDIESVERIAGTLSGGLAVKGPLGAPRYTGELKLRKGELALTGSTLGLDDVSVDVAIGGGELRVTHASATVGAGTLDMTGRVPLIGFGFGAASANITARNIKVPVGDGIDLTANADLVASYKPDSALPSYQNLPNVQGTVQIASFAYTRPIALSLNLNELSKSIRRTEVESYDPTQDFVSFDVNVVSPKPLRVQNDLVDMRLEVQDPGIELSGTNQRFGARGNLRLLPDSKIRLRNHEFDVREGYVHFEDPAKVKADVDVRAVTELRRYASADQTTGTDATSSTTSGLWDIAVRAHGPSDDLKLDLSSDPPLDQEDIVLLLTVGMTRAEIDRGLASSLGQTVGLEALSTLTGADKAVTSVVPIIDYFHFGSGYSSKTGRTEPNVTVGKRLTDDVRASVTTTLTEREVGATVEWRLKRGVSVQTSYDNQSNVNASIGNFGADLRWRLEFE